MSQVELRGACAALEEVLPQYCHTFMLVHFPVHVGDWIRLNGPLDGWWMFSFERMMNAFKRACKNRAAPEASIVSQYCRQRLTQQSLAATLPAVQKLCKRPIPGTSNDPSHKDSFVPLWLDKGVRLRAPILPGARTFRLLNSDAAQLRVLYCEKNPAFALIHEKFVAAANAVSARGAVLTWSVWMLSARLTDEERECVAGFSLHAVNVPSVHVNGVLVRSASFMKATTRVESSFVCALFDEVHWGRVRALVWHCFGDSSDDANGTVFAKCDWYRQPVTDSIRGASPYLNSSHVVEASAGQWVEAKQLVTQVVSIEGEARVYLLQA